MYTARYGSSGPVQSGGILAVPRGGGSGTVLAESDRGGHWSLAVDATHLYFTNQSHGTVCSVVK